MTTSTITDEQREKIKAYFAGKTIPAGLGSEEAACSIAGINLALSGRLTDTVPVCMSQVIGCWIIDVQDSMPADMRNSDEWRDLLPLAAGTGRKHEKARLAIVMDWMWGTVLPAIQHAADHGGYGEAWKKMCDDRTEASANAARDAARDPARAAAGAAARAAAGAAFWKRVAPAALLRRLIEEGA